jgi:DNA-binding Xre family transcriptional regulator
MLIFNIKRVFRLRDIEKPYTFMMKHGFSHMTAINLINGTNGAPKTAHIERLCLLLNCTPNDFYEWTEESGKNAIDDAHPLNTLRRDKAKGLKETIKDLPLEKLNEVEEFLKELKKVKTES